MHGHRQWSASDESAVRGVVVAYVDAWNQHDMEAMHALNLGDVEWINIAGNHWRGNGTVYAGHDNLHRTIFAHTTMQVDSVVIRAVDEAAIAVAAMRFAPLYMPSGEMLSEVRTHGTYVLVKAGGRWKIAHFQNTVIHPEAEKHDPATWHETGFDPRQAESK